MSMSGDPHFFVNLQANGAWLGGVCVDFSGPDLTVPQARSLIELELSSGTLICPTTITQDFEQHCRNLGIIAQALREVEMFHRWQHVEGPFLSNTPALGAHPPAHIQPADIGRLKRLIDASQDSIAILTVGPDVPGICALIEYAVQQGIVVSLGHHFAEPAQVAEAIAAGATWLTHFYNGIPLQVPRQGVLDFQLDSSLGAMVIPDGTHVRDHCLHLVLRNKGADNMIAVSDQSALCGAPLTEEGRWQDLWGKRVRVAKHPTLETRMVVGENNMLAGSWANMFWCMKYIAGLFERWDGQGERRTENDLWKIGCLNPLRVLARKVDECAHLPTGQIVLEDWQFVRLPTGDSD